MVSTGGLDLADMLILARGQAHPGAAGQRHETGEGGFHVGAVAYAQAPCVRCPATARPWRCGGRRGCPLRRRASSRPRCGSIRTLVQADAQGPKVCAPCHRSGSLSSPEVRPGRIRRLALRRRRNEEHRELINHVATTARSARCRAGTLAHARSAIASPPCSRLPISDVGNPSRAARPAGRCGAIDSDALEQQFRPAHQVAARSEGGGGEIGRHLDVARLQSMPARQLMRPASKCTASRSGEHAFGVSRVGCGSRTSVSPCA